MQRDVISTCPVCEGELRVTRLQCATCGTAIEGQFTVGRFGRLGRDQLALLESFLRARGNLRELERELGISYPTVRSRVEALVRALGLAEPGSAGGDGADASQAAAAAGSANRRVILERLARRELTAEEAAEALRAEQPGEEESER
jgi:hypothetical protein